MDAAAMAPFGKALLAYLEGRTTGPLIVRRDDGRETPIPLGLFYRVPSEFTAIENAALSRCTGRVLDVGAGTGLHSLELLRRGLQVTAIDISPDAVTIMKKRAIQDVSCADVMAFQGRRFDTLLMMGHGIGMVETIAGLDRLLTHAHELLSDEGQLLFDSLDVRATTNPADLAYHEKNRKAGRYRGEIRMQFEFEGEKGIYCGWLHVDPETLEQHAGSCGWKCEILRREESGEHLARLTRKQGA